MKKILALFVALAVLLTFGVDLALAGSIRGTVYEDVNGDGRCGPGDPILAWVPLKFTTNHSPIPIYLQSGDNGTYGLVAIGDSTWFVTAEPPAPWVVTSAKTREALIDPNNQLALNVDFCIADSGKIPARRTLPVSGAPISAPLAGIILLGFSLMASGLGLEWRRRRLG